MLSSPETTELLDALRRESKWPPRGSSPNASGNMQLTERIAMIMLGRSPPDSSLPTLASVLPKVLELYEQRTLDLLDMLDGRRHLGRSVPQARPRFGTLPATLSSPTPPSPALRSSFRTTPISPPPKRPAGKAFSDVGDASARARTSASPAPSKRPRTSAFSDPSTAKPSVEADLRARIAQLEKLGAAKDQRLAENDKEDARRKSDYLTIRRKLEAALVDICDDPADLVEQGRLFRQPSVSELTQRFVTYAAESVSDRDKQVRTIAGLEEKLRVSQDAHTFEVDARKAEIEQLNKKLNRLARERLQDNDASAAAAQDFKRDLASLKAKYTQAQQELAGKEEERADLAAQLTAATSKLDTIPCRRRVSTLSNSDEDDLSSSSAAAPGVDARTELGNLRSENARLKTDLARMETERIELADKLKHPAPILEDSDRPAGPLPAPSDACLASNLIDSLVKPYEAVFWALEAVEARLADSDVDGGARAIKKAKEKLRAMGPLWEEVERRKGVA